MQFISKVKTLYLHIGTEKTATTTIQELLFQNKSILRKHGYHIMECLEPRNNRQMVAYCVDPNKYKAFFNEYGITDSNLLEDFRKNLQVKIEQEINSLPSNIHSVIISSEHFHSRTNTKEEISRLHTLLSQFFASTYIICYLREQSDTCASLYSTAIKEGSCIVDFDTFMNRCKPKRIYFNYYNMLHNWEDCFGYNHLKIGIFENEKLLNHNLIDDFLAKLDMSSNIRQEINRNVGTINQSLTPIGQFLGQVFNIIYTDYDNLDAFDVVKTHLRKAISTEFAGKARAINPVTYQEIYQKFDKSNRELNQKYFSISENCFPYREPNKLDESSLLTSEAAQKAAKVMSIFLKSLFKSSNQYTDLLLDVAKSLQGRENQKSYQLVELASLLSPNDKRVQEQLKFYKDQYITTRQESLFLSVLHRIRKHLKNRYFKN